MSDRHAESTLRGSFCTSLRNRPIWKVMGPVITASAPMLEESSLQGSDFDLHLDYSKHLKILLLSRSSIESFKQETVMRLVNFSACIATAPQRHAIAFLLTEEPFSSASGKYSLERLSALQVLVAESVPDPLPIIPIPDSSSFLACIQEYISSLVDIPPFRRSLADTVSLLHNMRTPTSASLSEQDVNVLSDLFPSLRVLSQTVRTQEGGFLLEDYLGGQLAREIMEFWEEDRVYD